MAKSKDKPGQDDENTQPQPGAVITPGATPPASPEPAEAPEPSKAVEPAVAEPSTKSSQVSRDGESVTWTASEFVAHEKSTVWYLSLALAALILAALIYLITRDVVSVAVVAIGGIILGFYATHQPRQLEYEISQRGLSIGDKYHGYDEFKSFSILPEGAFSSIIFMPLKRFAPPITIYYAPEDEEKILAVLTGSLPYEEPRRDAVDSLMKRIRF